MGPHKKIPRKKASHLHIAKYENAGSSVMPIVFYSFSKENFSKKTASPRRLVGSGPAERVIDRRILSRFLQKKGYKLDKDGVVVKVSGRPMKPGNVTTVKKLLKNWEPLWSARPKNKSAKK